MKPGICIHSEAPWSTRRVALLAAASIVLGAAFRFAWSSDIEFKADESYMFDRTQRVGVSEPWPAVGMPSGVGTRNPGMSVWFFVVLARVLRAATPPELAFGVMALNVAALALAFLFTLRTVDEPRREEWLWAIALVATNPFAVLLQRKIWAQSVLPLFVVLFWIGWWRRDRLWGAFGWGLVGALLGQIHMSGFFLAAAVFAWEQIETRRTTPNAPHARWRPWLLGALPMLPWLAYLANRPRMPSVWNWRELVTPSFWVYGFTDPLGLGLHYNLGVASFLEFLRYPLVAGVPTYLVAVAHVVVALVGGVTLASGFASARRRFRQGWRPASGDATGRALRATFMGYGVLLTLSGVVIYRHYLVVTFPLEWVLFCGVALHVKRHGRQLLLSLWASELFITAALLLYLHVHGGAPGDYGTAYRLQLPASPSAAPAKSQVAPTR
jgi:hypothetical protein